MLESKRLVRKWRERKMESRNKRIKSNNMERKKINEDRRKKNKEGENKDTRLRKVRIKKSLFHFFFYAPCPFRG